MPRDTYVNSIIPPWSIDKIGYIGRHLSIKMSSFLRAFEDLEGLPGTTWHRLYKQPSTALAVFRRMLPHLGAQWLTETYVMELTDSSSKAFRHGTTVHQPSVTGDGFGSLGTTGA